uniref:C-C motif chemokine receptor 6 n=1 Tax=Ursus maritimus TaxID=29073 RepID=A0A452U4L0_URSMA
MSGEAMNFSTVFNFNEDYFGLGNTSDYSFDDDTLLCSLQEVRKFSGLFVPMAYSLICVFGLLGNILVVVTFAFYKKAKSMTDVYLLNMAIADILFVLTLPFWAVSHATGKWIFSNAMCKLMKGIYAINFNCGMLLLACISMDRYIAIVQATKSFRLRSRTLAHRRVICVVVWAASVLISGWTFVFNQKYRVQGSDVCEPRYHEGSDPIKWKLLMLGLQLLFGFFIPLVFMVFCYMFIVKTLVQAQNSKRHKAIRVVVAVVLVFLACQVPHNMVLLVDPPLPWPEGAGLQHERHRGPGFPALLPQPRALRLHRAEVQELLSEDCEGPVVRATEAEGSGLLLLPAALGDLHLQAEQRDCGQRERVVLHHVTGPERAVPEGGGVWTWTPEPCPPAALSPRGTLPLALPKAGPRGMRTRSQPWTHVDIFWNIPEAALEAPSLLITAKRTGFGKPRWEKIT